MKLISFNSTVHHTVLDTETHITEEISQYAFSAVPKNIPIYLRKFPNESFVHASGRTLVHAEYSYRNGSLNTKHQQLNKKSAVTALNTVLV
jgi:hypothetical protein